MNTESAMCKPVMSMRLAQYLIRHGHDLKRVTPSRNHENFVVFFFEESEEVERSISDYITVKNKERK